MSFLGRLSFMGLSPLSFHDFLVVYLFLPDFVLIPFYFPLFEVRNCYTAL